MKTVPCSSRLVAVLILHDVSNDSVATTKVANIANDSLIEGEAEETEHVLLVVGTTILQPVSKISDLVTTNRS